MLFSLHSASNILHLSPLFKIFVVGLLILVEPFPPLFPGLSSCASIASMSFTQEPNFMLCQLLFFFNPVSCIYQFYGFFFSVGLHFSTPATSPNFLLTVPILIPYFCLSTLKCGQPLCCLLTRETVEHFGKDSPKCDFYK